MQKNIQNLLGFVLKASDSGLGNEEEYYFDDRTWQVLYFAFGTDNFICEKKVLISIEKTQNIKWLESKNTVEMKVVEIKEYQTFNESEYMYSKIPI